MVGAVGRTLSLIAKFRIIVFHHCFTRLKERLTLICKANPWLAGRLVKNKKVHKNILLAMPQPLAKEDIDALICNDEHGALSGISTQTPYEVICDEVLKSKMVVGPGYKLVGKDLRCSKFSLVKLSQGQVALIVSITHTVADGMLQLLSPCTVAYNMT